MNRQLGLGLLRPELMAAQAGPGFAGHPMSTQAAAPASAAHHLTIADLSEDRNQEADKALQPRILPVWQPSWNEIAMGYGRPQERPKRKKKLAFDEGPLSQIYMKQVQRTFLRWGAYLRQPSEARDAGCRLFRRRGFTEQQPKRSLDADRNDCCSW